MEVKAQEGARGSRERGGRRGLLAIGAAALAVAGAFGGYSWWTRNQQSTENAQVEADVVPLSARIGGTVQQLHVQDNQAVAQGAPLLELDPADYAARLQQAEAELEAAKAQADAADAQVQIVQATAHGGLTAAQAQYSGSAVSVKSADAQVAFATAALARSRTEAGKTSYDLARMQKLRAQGDVSQSQLDNAQTASDAAQSGVSQAQAQQETALEQRRLAETKVAEARGRLDQSVPIDALVAAAQAAAKLAHARVRSLEASRELARLQLGYTRLAAPVAGRISKLAVHEGQTLQPGQTVVELVPATTYIVANFKETQVARMRAGQQASIEVDAFPGRTFAGRVASISAATGARFSLLPPDNATGNFVKVVQWVPVRIEWQEPPGSAPLQAGLAALVTVFLE